MNIDFPTKKLSSRFTGSLSYCVGYIYCLCPQDTALNMYRDTLKFCDHGHIYLMTQHRHTVNTGITHLLCNNKLIVFLPPPGDGQYERCLQTREEKEHQAENTQHALGDF